MKKISILSVLVLLFLTGCFGNKAPSAFEIINNTAIAINKIDSFEFASQFNFESSESKEIYKNVTNNGKIILSLAQFELDSKNLFEQNKHFKTYFKDNFLYSNFKDNIWMKRQHKDFFSFDLPLDSASSLLQLNDAQNVTPSISETLVIMKKLNNLVNTNILPEGYEIRLPLTENKISELMKVLGNDSNLSVSSAISFIRWNNSYISFKVNKDFYPIGFTVNIDVTLPTGMFLKTNFELTINNFNNVKIEFPQEALNAIEVDEFK